MKKCKRCGEIKPKEEFFAHPTSKDGRVNICKKCRNELNKTSEGKKVCKKCKQELPLEYFSKDYRTPDGYCYTCKTCCKNNPSATRVVMPWELVY